jgi:hydrogenase-4 component B
MRRGPAWDCGFPDPGPATQYTADSFAQPIRRVFGAVVFRARAGDNAAARRHGPPASKRRCIATRSGTRSMRRSPAAVGATAQLLNHLQFLTIRRYLGFVFGALIVLLLALAFWQ